MKKPLIIGNWKANPKSIKEAKALLKLTEKLITRTKNSYGYAVPDAFLFPLKEEKPRGMLGAQTIGTKEDGAHTGESSASMISSVGGTFTLLGHSEIRALGETDESINAKIKSTYQEGLYSVVCVGEKSRDNHGTYLKHIEEQLKKSLHEIPGEWCEKLAIAYEPIWAIGADTSATPEQCFEVVIVIRRTLAALFGMAYAKKVCVLYGGTVTKNNAESFLVEGGADGLLIGRTSLDPKAFASIVTTTYATIS